MELKPTNYDAINAAIEQVKNAGFAVSANPVAHKSYELIKFWRQRKRFLRFAHKATHKQRVDIAKKARIYLKRFNIIFK